MIISNVWGIIPGAMKEFRQGIDNPQGVLQRVPLMQESKFGTRGK